MLEHPHGDLVLTHDRQRTSHLFQMPDRGTRMGSRDDFQPRIGGARLFDHLPRLEGFRHSHEETTGFMQVRGRQHAGIGGIADEDLGTVPASGGDLVKAFLEHEHRAACGTQA